MHTRRMTVLVAALSLNLVVFAGVLMVDPVAAQAPGVVTDLAGDKDNFGYGIGSTWWPPCNFYDRSEPNDDLGVFDREPINGDEGDSWTHTFTPPANVESVEIHIREFYSNQMSPTIDIDGMTFGFITNGLSFCNEPIVQTFYFTGASAAFAADGQINIAFHENGDNIALDYSEVIINDDAPPAPALSCVANFEPDNAVYDAFSEAGMQVLSVFPDDKAAIGFTGDHKANNGRDAFQYVLDDECGSAGGNGPVCSTSDASSCIKSMVFADDAGLLNTVERTTNTANVPLTQTYQHLRTPTILVNGSVNQVALSGEVGSSLGSMCWASDAYLPAAANHRVFVACWGSPSHNIYAIDKTGLVATYTCGTGTFPAATTLCGSFTATDGNTPYGFMQRLVNMQSGASATFDFVKYNLATGAQVGSAIGSHTVPGNIRPNQPVQGSGDTVWGSYSTGNIAPNYRAGFTKITNSTWTVAQQALWGGTGLIPSTATNTQTAYIDVDAVDDFLICGTTTVSGITHGFFARGTPSTNAVTDITTIVGPGNVFLTPVMCQLDYAGGFWLLGNYYNSNGQISYQLRHYAGGFAARPAPTDRSALYPDPPTAPRDLVAAPGPGAGQITLNWQPPLTDGGASVTGYKVYRGDSLGSQTLLPDANPNGLTFTDSGLGHSTTRYYRITAVNSVGEGPSSSVVASTTFSSTPGEMSVFSHPQCAPAGDPVFVSSCNSRRFGYTDSIWTTDGDHPTFDLDWGDFNGHSHVLCSGEPCPFWLMFDLTAVDAGLFGGEDGQIVDVAQLERKDAFEQWEPVAGGLLQGRVVVAGSEQGVVLPLSLMLTAEAFGTDDGAAEFRLKPLPVAWNTNQNWVLEVDAAQSQLVAPPLVLVRGWSSESGEANYLGDAEWAEESLKPRLISRAEYVYGQNPWAWSLDGAIQNPEIDAKADFRLASFTLYDRILLVRENPQDLSGDSLEYTGPVNVIAHSMGGLISRYLAEDVLPTLQDMHGGSYSQSDAISQALNQRTSDEDYAPADFVSSLITMGTPHLGSGWAEDYIVQIDGWSTAGSCLVGFFTSLPDDTCAPYYVTKGGSRLLEHEFPFQAKPKAWWTDPIGAYRNTDLGWDTTSVMSDFELTRIKDGGNPVLWDLDARFASRPLDGNPVPSGVDYFSMAGLYKGNGDGIVSVKSASHDKDARICSTVYTDQEANYGPLELPLIPHNSLPYAMKLQDDALVFMAGEKISVCGNPPDAPGEGASMSAAGASDGDEPTTNGDAFICASIPETLPTVPTDLCRDLLEGDAQGPAEGSFAPMSAAELNTVLADSEQYEPPVSLNLSIDAGIYSMRLEWNSPGSSNGSLALQAFNGTLPGATLTLRSPSGGIATLSGGDTSWAEWGDLETFGEDHGLDLGMSDAAQGTWALWINRTSPWPGFLVSSVVFDMPSSIETQTDPYGIMAQPLTYRIRLAESGQAALGANVSLQYLDPVLGSQTMLLLDDGIGPDGLVDDGIYSGARTFATNSTVPYLATATIDGRELRVDGAVPILDEAPSPRRFPPTPPLDLSAATGPGGGEITLAWNAPDEDGGTAITGYDIYGDNETGSPVLIASTGNVSAYTLHGLGNNATGHYRIAARNAVGFSRLSNGTNATTFDVPSAPLNLTATTGGAGEIDLAWQAPTFDGRTPVTNYTIYSGDSAESLSLLATVGNVLGYTDSQLGDNVTRFYRVAAVNVAGEGEASDDATATTPTFAPNAPLNLTVVAGAGAGQLTLTWQSPAKDGGDPVANYTIYRGGGPEAMSVLATVGAVLGYTDSGLGNDATWHYAVAAVNTAGEGPRSSEANGTTFDLPTAPLNLTAEAGPGAGEITLTWQVPTSNGGTPVTNYTVYSGPAGANLALLATLGDVLTFTDSNLGNNATRYYAVTATNLAGESLASNEASATTFAEPTAPQNLEAMAGIGNVSLKWEPAAIDGGAPVTGYNVYRGNASDAETLYASLGVVLNYTDSNATPGTRYYYRVTSLNTAGEGALSNEVSARPSTLLVAVPGTPLPPTGILPATATITVCDAGSDAGCTVPGDSHLCVELQTSAAPAVKLACIDHALVPPEIDAALHELEPIEITTPDAIDSTPALQVTYLHEAALLNPLIAACAPFHPTPEDATWFLANGNETSLTVTLKGGPATGEPVTIPWLGQIVAASQASGGETQCA